MKKGFSSILIYLLACIVCYAPIWIFFNVPFYLMPELLDIVHYSQNVSFLLGAATFLLSLYISFLIWEYLVERNFTYHQFLDNMFEGESRKYHGSVCISMIALGAIAFSPIYYYFVIGYLGVRHEGLLFMIGMIGGLFVYALFVSNEQHKKNRENGFVP